MHRPYFRGVQRDFVLVVMYHLFTIRIQFVFKLHRHHLTRNMRVGFEYVTYSSYRIVDKDCLMHLTYERSDRSDCLFTTSATVLVTIDRRRVPVNDTIAIAKCLSYFGDCLTRIGSALDYLA